jgi:hypothetical protein
VSKSRTAHSVGDLSFNFAGAENLSRGVFIGQSKLCGFARFACRILASVTYSPRLTFGTPSIASSCPMPAIGRGVIVGRMGRQGLFAFYCRTRIRPMPLHLNERTVGAVCVSDLSIQAIRIACSAGDGRAFFIGWSQSYRAAPGPVTVSGAWPSTLNLTAGKGRDAPILLKNSFRCTPRKFSRPLVREPEKEPGPYLANERHKERVS